MDTGSLRFVDKVGRNLLFRGGKPITNGAFDPALKTALAKAYDGMPAQYYLVVICLLHTNSDDSPDIAAELEYFENDSGEIHLWDTLGTELCCFDRTPAERDRMLKTLDQWLGDPLIWRIATLRQWLETSQLPFRPQTDPQADLPCVFYVHCSGGCDRTGELIGAYRLRYMGASWLDMWGEQPCGRPMGCSNYRALQWYAFWLNETFGLAISGIGEDGGCLDGNAVDRPCSPILQRSARG
jgi:hypothetical protein